MQGVPALGVEGLGVDLRFREEGPHAREVALFDGHVEGVVQTVVHGREVNVVGEEDAADGGEIVLGRHV